MKPIKTTALLALVLGLSACAENAHGPNKTIDKGTDKKHLSQLKAGIWVDPEGCDHWIIDDGVEGYLTQRVDDYGKPICSGAARPTEVVGPFKSGSSIWDPL